MQSAFIRFVTLCLLILVVSPSFAAEPLRNFEIAPKGAEKRVALVIGNSNYPGASLRNPANDAKDMAAALRGLGFEVISKTDLTQKEMNRAIAQFGEKLRADTVALFYYAGHGMQVRGKNYLIPIDARIASEASSRAEAVDVDTIMDQLGVSPLNIVILDACRNNPFERRFRSVGGGLAQMNAPMGTLIAYATAPGKVANDGGGRNGLYTRELLKHIQTPGLPLEAVFKRVRNDVMQDSGDAQTPWEASSLTGDFYFRPADGAVAAAPRLATPTSNGAMELAFWETIKNSTDADDFQAYLDKYPNGEFAALAQSRAQKNGQLAEAAPEKPAASTAVRKDIPDIAGTWYWSMSTIFVPDRINTVKADGTCMLNTGTSCGWSYDAEDRKIAFHFSDTWTHTMRLSEDRQFMMGTDDWGTSVTGRKAAEK